MWLIICVSDTKLAEKGRKAGNRGRMRRRRERRRREREGKGEEQKGSFEIADTSSFHSPLPLQKKKKKNRYEKVNFSYVGFVNQF